MKKKICLVCSLFFCLSVMAQQNDASLLFSQSGKKSDYVRKNTNPLTPLKYKPAEKKTRGGSRWFDIIDAIDKDQGGGGNIYQNDSYNITWTDSTMLAPFNNNGATVYDGIWLKNVAVFFDPADPRYNDPVAYAGEIGVSRNTTYTLDSLFFPYIYSRNPNKPNIVDTLIISVLHSNGTGTSNDFAIRYYGPASQTAINHGTDTLRFLHGFLNLNTASPNAYTFEASAPGNVVNIKVPLTAATLIDTLANGFNYVQIPIGLTIPSGRIPGASVTFKSGDTWVPYLDTAYISGAATPKFNNYRFVAFEENATGYQTYIKGYWSQSSIMKNDTTGWKNWHIPSYAFTNTTYEHQWYSWKITCNTCAPVGLSSTELENASLNLFPNPASRDLYLNLKTNESLKEVYIQLTSIDGRTIMTEHIGDVNENTVLQKSINVSTLTKGIYLFSIHSGGSSINRKVVIE